MNKLLIVATLATSLLGSQIAFAGDIAITPQSYLEASCQGADVKTRFYIPNDKTSLTYYPKDIFYTNTLSIITSTSEIKSYQSIPNYFGSACTDWFRPANIALPDAKGYIAVSNYDGCTLTKQKAPTGMPIVQFVYKIHYKEETGKTTGTGVYTYAPEFIDSLPNTGITTYPLADQTKRTWTAEKVHANVCVSYYVSYCGDGVVDNTNFANGNYTEQCDPAAPGQSSATCNPTTCTPIDNHQSVIQPTQEHRQLQ